MSVILIIDIYVCPKVMRKSGKPLLVWGNLVVETCRLWMGWAVIVNAFKKLLKVSNAHTCVRTAFRLPLVSRLECNDV